MELKWKNERVKKKKTVEVSKKVTRLIRDSGTSSLYELYVKDERISL